MVTDRMKADRDDRTPLSSTAIAERDNGSVRSDPPLSDSARVLQEDFRLLRRAHWLCRLIGLEPPNGV
jgi:hypothetical protein